jgi:tRNA modification GTPase
LALTLVDTAGVRDTGEQVEREGVRRSVEAAGAAELVLVVFDQSEALSADDQRVIDDTRTRRRLLVKNKSDAPDCCDLGEAGPALAVSARTGSGLDVLRCTIARALGSAEPTRDLPAISNTRHVALLEDARVSLDRARTGALAGASEEFVAADLQQARERFDEIVGRRTHEDVLRHIFERFCIGK